MREILPGLYHWTAFHQGIGSDVSSYYAAGSRALIDPMLPADGLESFRDNQPQVILLTNRHHYRKSDAFVDAYGCPVLCHESGLHEFEGGGRVVKGFSFGDELAEGIVALEMDAICPDDSVLRIDVGKGALAFADGLVHWGEGRIGFVPDGFMDDPDAVKRGLRASLRRLAEEDFDALLFAHGEPIVSDGKEVLRDFIAE
jgi:hypothetical protein